MLIMYTSTMIHACIVNHNITYDHAALQCICLGGDL